MEKDIICNYIKGNECMELAKELSTMIHAGWISCQILVSAEEMSWLCQTQANEKTCLLETLNDLIYEFNVRNRGQCIKVETLFKWRQHQPIIMEIKPINT